MNFDDQGQPTRDVRHIKRMSDRDQAYASFIRRVWRQRQQAAERQNHDTTQRVIPRTSQ